LSHNPNDIYEYFDNPEKLKQQIQKSGQAVVERTKNILKWKPDVLLIGNSGLMLFNPPEILRDLTLRWLQEVTKLAKQAGVITHMHCCGPERKLIEIAANESDLDSIEPLEMPPMGDCDLKEIKTTFGHRMALKGNLHTTETMLFGTVEKVEEDCKRAIDDAAQGGGFILATGDQTPRDTPFDNIFAMQRIAETYGKY
jgi:uroporphyrinogen decarboxylase